jgi:hypothetical protein
MAAIARVAGSYPLEVLEHRAATGARGRVAADQRDSEAVVVHRHRGTHQVLHALAAFQTAQVKDPERPGVSTRGRLWRRFEGHRVARGPNRREPGVRV